MTAPSPTDVPLVGGSHRGHTVRADGLPETRYFECVDCLAEYRLSADGRSYEFVGYRPRLDLLPKPHGYL